MQRPSNCPVTTPFGYVKGYPLNGGYHMGVDFAYTPDNKIYAPEDGNYRLYPNNGSLGNAIHMWTGNKHHAFGHTSKYLITDNQFCKRGQPIAIMGATGAADGVHLHWALAINGSLVDPLSQVNESFIKQGEDMPIPDADNYYWRYGQKLALLTRGRQLTRDEFRKHIVGQTDLRAVEILSDDPEADRAQAAQQWAIANRAAVEKQIADLKVVLANEQAKLSKEVVKEVEKIVNVPIVDTTATAQIAETNSIVKQIWSFLTSIFIKKG